MAKITTGSTFGCTSKQTLAMQLLAEGHNIKDVAIACFDCVTEDGHQALDEKKLRKAKATIRKWQQDPKVQACYRAIIYQDAMPAYGKAFQTITKQMDDPNAWLANKAANDVLTRFGPAIMGEEDKQIVVQVQGMPELGEPVDEE